MFYSYNLPFRVKLTLLMLSIFKLNNFSHAFNTSQEEKMHVQAPLNIVQLLF